MTVKVVKVQRDNSNSMDALHRLIDALRCLPGVGPKSAQRMVYYLLQHQRPKGLHLAQCLEEAMIKIKQCNQCNDYTTQELCALCQSSVRDNSVLCVVESPCDIIAIEQSHAFNGLYFVLMGKISPLDGVSAEDIGLPRLAHLVKTKQIKEVILAFSPSVESQITIHFIDELLASFGVHLSQLAHGIPSGGELEFLDSMTISSALRNRARIHA